MTRMTTTRFDGLCIIDADTHLTEPHDLWTARAPKGYEDRVPQVHEIDGVPTWTMDGHIAGTGRRVRGGRRRRREGRPAPTFFQWTIEDVHAAAYDVDARARVDGRAGHLRADRLPEHRRLRRPEVLRPSTTRAAAAVGRALQRRHGRDPGPVGPAAVPDGASCRGGTSTSRSREIERIARVWDCAASTPRPRRTTTAFPTSATSTGTRCGRPRAANDLPINFHIGASDSSLTWFGIGAVAVAQRRPEARARFGDDVPEQRRRDRQPHLLGRARALPDAAVRVGRERRRVDPVPAGGARLPAGRDARRSRRAAVAEAVGVLQAPDPRVLLVRAQRHRRGDRRRSAPTT